MNYFFTADTHFGHQNIIKFCDRPYKTIEEMDAEIIRRWNSVVGKNDIIYHLGDFSYRSSEFDKYFDQLNGKIIIILGNHDKLARQNKHKFYKAHEGFLETKIMELSFTLCHYAMRTWNKSHYGAYHLYGHSHGTLPDDRMTLSFDCGVDTHGFYPYSLDEVLLEMQGRDFVGVS